MKLEADEVGAGRPETVAALTRRIAGCLEAEFGAVWVVGEVAGLRQQASGHLYFTLRDEGAQIQAVLFRSDALRAGVALRDGLQVVVRGELSVYPPRGGYQIVVRRVVDEGAGRRQAQIEELKRRLAAEGLFAPEKRRPLPLVPSRVGFVTSPTGAVAQDFCRILERRGWRGRLVILPSRVQGEEAPAELRAMVERAGALRLGPEGTMVEPAGADDPRPRFFELLVIGRGGGGTEDLAPFQDEALVRAVAVCPVPIVSAVGHETDFTLCDLAADRRAETPSAAAELLTAAWASAVERVADARRRWSDGIHLRLDRAADAADLLAARLRGQSPMGRLERGQLRADDLANRLASASAQRLQEAAQRLWRLRHELSAHAPSTAWQRARATIAEYRQRLAARGPAARLEVAQASLSALRARLAAVSPGAALRRGFALVRTAEGRLVTTSRAAVGDLELEFADGRVAVRPRPEDARQTAGSS